MNYLILLTSLLISLTAQMSAQQQDLNELFDKYRNTEGVTTIKIGKPMFNMLGKISTQDTILNQMKPMFEKIQDLKMLVIKKPELESGRNFETFKTLQEDIAKTVRQLNYEELMTLDSDADRIKFLSSAPVNGFMDNLLLSINSGDEMVLMILGGKISMADVKKMALENQQNTHRTSFSYSSTNIPPQGNVRHIAPFQSIEASNGVSVFYRQGTNRSVTVVTDADKEQYIKTEVSDGILKIYVDAGSEKNINFRQMIVNIEAPELQSVRTSMGANFTTLENTALSNLSIWAETGSSLNLKLEIKNALTVKMETGSSAKISASTTTFDFTGTSVKLDGTAKGAIFRLSGATSCNAQDFIVTEADAFVNSASTIKLHPTERLNASATSAGSIRYKGKPKNLSTVNHSGGLIKAME